MNDQQGPCRRPDADVPRLTSVGRDGPYKRRADVEAQIRAALLLPRDKWASQAPLRGGWTNETRVHLVRRISTSDPALSGALLDTLMKRIGPVVEQWAQGFDEAEFDGIADAVTIKIVGRILAKEASPSSEILEVCFTEIVKRETLKEVAKRNVRREVNLPAPTVEDEEGQAIDATSTVKDERPDPLASLIKERERDPTLREMLKAVTDPRHRRAFILHEIRKWPYQPGNPPRPCLCKLFNKSERRIRSWIGIARKQMQESLGDRT